MPCFKKLATIILVVVVSSLYAQPAGIQVGETAPEFSMYLYKDKTFDTDSIYGKKILSLIFGSIT